MTDAEAWESIYRLTDELKRLRKELAELRAIARAAVNDCATAIEDQRHAWEEAAQSAGDRRDWDGTDNYEAMAEAAARLEGIVRSRSTLSPHGEVVE